mmetsp:Transcript_5341/g.7837  ORF Transcript_5341/g.7837 Transcript_5341/m.7837 type:complete len:409 (-) Transcript_5341:143-1369(-)
MLQTDNYGINNNGDLYNCEGSFWQESEVCSEFTAQSCLADYGFDSPIQPPVPITSVPTAVPTIIATLSSISPVLDAPTTPTSLPSTQPSTAPTPNSKENYCHDNWQDIAYEIEQSYGNETFVVCPGTTFRVSSEDTIEMYAPNIRLMCGNDGTLRNNCSFDGGTTHLSIPGGKKATHLFVSGFTFRNAVETSVEAFGSEEAIAIFHDCVWENNSGEFGGAVNVYHHSGVAMSIFFENCVFTGNEAPFGAAIMIEDGTVNVTRCLFEDNLLGWPIEVEGTLILEDSCFVTNNGTVYVYEDGHATFSDISNFASGNFSPLAGYVCEGIYDEAQSFPRNCVEFKAAQCMATSVPPTSSPTIFLSQNPTSSTTDAPVASVKTAGASHAPAYMHSVIIVFLLSIVWTWKSLER